MANPRQRRKARSPKYSGATKSARRASNKKVKRAPPMMGPQVLRDNWDPHLTVRQNYAKLGLVPTLSGHQSGGLDHRDPYAQASKNPAPVPADAQPRKGMARIIRDEQGKVVKVIENTDDDADTTPWGRRFDSDEKRDPDPPMLPPRLHQGHDTPAVEELAKMADEAAPVERYTSAGEFSWLAELVQAHGEDVEAMARDRKWNLWQRTPGEIRRALRKAGGAEALRHTLA